MKASNFILPLLFALLFLSGPQSQAQEGSLFEAPAEQHSLLPKTDFGFQLGTSFMTGFQGTSLFSQSLAPHFKWNPSQRFSMMVGSVFSTGQFSGNAASTPFGLFQGEAMYGVMSQRLFSNTVYAFGAYQLSPRLTITGGSWMEHNNYQYFQPNMNNQAFNLNPRGVMMGFDYKISENFRFGAQFNVSQGYNPYNPFNSTGAFQRGFFPTSPFQRNTPW
ncbi:MAG: hypothetical protein V2I46_13210 [Bacteroides sp.]|jgi:hypothetical protein|nr:hypothetical protein [Bacteroides sp.]